MYKFRQNIDVVVYTMGKVGSSTVSTSLKTAGLFCLDIHFWTKARIIASLEQSIEDPNIEFIPEHLIESILARNALARQKRLKIITLVRNPIMRNISAVFQNMPRAASDDFDRMIKRLRDYPVRTPDFWFESDFAPAMGVDVLSMNFDRSADHFILGAKELDILILKLETPDDRMESILSDFVGTDVKLTRTNEADKKWYYDIYKQIIDDPSIVRPTFVQECLGLKYYKTFYTEEDAQTLAKRFEQAS